MPFPLDMPIVFGANPNTLEHTSDVADRAKALLLYVFQTKPRINGVLGALGKQLQDLEDAAFDVRLQRAIDNAEGAQLDVIGRIVGQPRGALDDTAYKARLRVRRLINRSSGKHEEIIKILTGFENTTETGIFELIDTYPASMLLFQHVAPATSVEEIAELLRSIKGGGVGMRYVYVPDGVEHAFTFSSVTDDDFYDTDSEDGFGSVTDPDLGGDLSGVVSV